MFVHFVVAFVCEYHIPAKSSVTDYLALDFGNHFTSLLLKDDNFGFLYSWPDEYVHIPRLVPTVVAFSGDEILCGEAAQTQRDDNPGNTIVDFVPLIGLPFDHPDVQAAIRDHAYKIVDMRGSPFFEVVYQNQTRHFSPVEITSMFCAHLKRVIIDDEQKSILNTVCLVSSTFSAEQIQGLEQAVNDAGLISVAIRDRGSTFMWEVDEQFNVVFDLGGSICDVSIVMSKGYAQKETLQPPVRSRIGGDDFDQRLIDHLCESYMQKTGQDPRSNGGSMSRLKHEAMNAKHVLSRENSTTIVVEDFNDGDVLNVTLTQDEFNELNIDLFRSAVNQIAEVLNLHNLSMSDIEGIYLIGGSTRIPMISRLISQVAPTTQIFPSAEPDVKSVTQTAQNAFIFPSDMYHFHYTPLSILCEYDDGLKEIVRSNSILPATWTLEFFSKFDANGRITLDFYEGVSKITKDNHYLGRIQLQEHIMYAGSPQFVHIDVKVFMNNTVHIFARTDGLWNSGEITIPGASRLTLDQCHEAIAKVDTSQRFDTDRLYPLLRPLWYVIYDPFTESGLWPLREGE